MRARDVLAMLAIVLMPVAPITGAVPGALVAPAPAEAADQTPAVEVEEAPTEGEDEPWTARYLAPTVLAMGAVVIALVVVFYAVRVRGRYRVVR